VRGRDAGVPGASLGGEGLAEICFEIKCRTAPPDPDGGKLPDRAVFVDTTFDGAGSRAGISQPNCTSGGAVAMGADNGSAGPRCPRLITGLCGCHAAACFSP
jgi:hypothetical protein